MHCQHTSCYLTFICRLQKNAHQCALHRWYLESKDKTDLLSPMRANESIEDWLKRSEKEFPDIFKAADTIARELVIKLKEENEYE